MLLCFNQEEEKANKSFTFSKADSKLTRTNPTPPIVSEQSIRKVVPLKIQIEKPDRRIKIDKASFRVDESKMHKRPISRTQLSQKIWESNQAAK